MVHTSASARSTWLQNGTFRLSQKAETTPTAYSVVIKWVSKQRSENIVKANRLSIGFSAAITPLGTMSIMWPWWPCGVCQCAEIRLIGVLNQRGKSRSWEHMASFLVFCDSKSFTNFALVYRVQSLFFSCKDHLIGCLLSAL